MGSRTSTVHARLALCALLGGAAACAASDPQPSPQTRGGAGSSERDSAPATSVGDDAPTPGIEQAPLGTAELVPEAPLPPPVGDVDPLAQLPGEADRFTDA